MEEITHAYCIECKKTVDDVLLEYVDDPSEPNLQEIRIACAKDNSTLIEM